VNISSTVSRISCLSSSFVSTTFGSLSADIFTAPKLQLCYHLKIVSNLFHQNLPQTPSGSFQNFVDEVRGSGSINDCGTFIRSGTKIFGTGFNVSSNLAVGDQTNRDVFTEVLGLTGQTILDWFGWGTDQNGGLTVRYDDTTLAGGENDSGQAGVDPHSSTNQVLVMQEIFIANPVSPSGLIKDTQQFTVASLPATPNTSEIAFATDGRKIGEGAGSGTGVLVYFDGTDWKRSSDDSTVVA